MQETYDRFGKISMGVSSNRNNMITMCVGKGVRGSKPPLQAPLLVRQLFSLVDLRP